MCKAACVQRLQTMPTQYLLNKMVAVEKTGALEPRKVPAHASVNNY